MSLIPGKTILVIGDENASVHAVEAALRAAGATLIHGRCDTATIESITAQKVDLVLLNHLHDGSHCLPFLNTLRTTRLAHVLPVLALVDDNQTAIEHALSLGAADYFTPGESIDRVLLKVRVGLGESLSTADLSVLDISEKPHAPQRTNVKVCIVEDDPLLINLLSMRMERAGFRYVVHRTGEEVVREMAVFMPDVILLDLTLPTISGFEVLEALRHASHTSTVPVIIFSNRDSAEDRTRATVLGATRFYLKVMTDLSILMREIEELASFSNSK